MSISWKIWLMAVGSIVVISLCGLLSVIVIPIMDKIFYNQLLHFLIALAVGTLVGDALLHLLPHGFSQSHEKDNHQVIEEDHGEDLDHQNGGEHDLGVIWAGLTVLAGIYGFFLIEQLTQLVRNWKRQTRSHERANNKDDSKSATVDEMEIRERELAPLNDGHLSTAGHHSAQQTHVVNHEHEHDESEGHGHSHTVPNSLSSAAWMVVMGDGLHNFTDGLAIGTSYMSGLSVGLSTTIAVFCHELPHELGDFAILLKAGMTVRRAIVYNLVSSILSLAGLFVGLALGGVESATTYVFTVTAGIFIYIALVDMLPELTCGLTTEKLRSAAIAVFLHSLGIGLGMSIMLMIAIYEDKIYIPIND